MRWRTLTFFLECEFALLVVVFVLSSSSVFTTLEVFVLDSSSLRAP